MSAVSSESPLADADLSEPSANTSTPGASGAQPPGANFGANEWLVDELYQRYLADPGSVDRAWWSFFADYRPVRSANGTGPYPVLKTAPVTPAAAAPAQSPAPAVPAPAVPAQPASQQPASQQAGQQPASHAP